MPEYVNCNLCDADETEVLADNRTGASYLGSCGAFGSHHGVA